MLVRRRRDDVDLAFRIGGNDLGLNRHHVLRTQRGNEVILQAVFESVVLGLVVDGGVEALEERTSVHHLALLVVALMLSRLLIVVFS